ncbi:MAG TPA: hypothetical protein VKB14_16385 [Actinomycetales bacterium]|nr:hypothetical protein [Actinomycetales bacterium]
MTRTLTRGLFAGAAGTTVLDALGYLDMAVRGRPASTLPAQTVEAIGERLGVSASVPKDVRESRHAAMGALGGIGAGLAVGVAASAARRWGFRPPRALGAVATAAAAMAATDVPAAALGVTDPRTWTAADWVSDAVPHLGYGLAVDAVLRRDPTPEAADREPASASLVLRSAALGVAAGSRSSLGLAASVLLSQGSAGLGRAVTGRAAGTLATAGVAAELVADKLPQTPSRLQPPVLATRLASGASGAVALARRAGARPAAPAVAGLFGAGVGSFGGFAWRQWAGRRVPDWQAALVEDGVAVLLALAASLPGRTGAVRLPGGGLGSAETSEDELAPGETAAHRPLRVGKAPRLPSSPGTFPGLRAYRPSGRRDRRRGN